MPEFIDATFYVDGSIFVNNLITHETSTLNSDDSLYKLDMQWSNRETEISASFQFMIYKREVRN